MLGVSNDAPQANLAFKDKFDFKFDLLCDESMEMGVAYGAAASTAETKLSRISYLIDTEGKVKKVYEKVVAAEHPEEVLKDLG